MNYTSRVVPWLAHLVYPLDRYHILPFYGLLLVLILCRKLLLRMNLLKKARRSRYAPEPTYFKAERK